MDSGDWSKIVEKTIDIGYKKFILKLYEDVKQKCKDVEMRFDRHCCWYYLSSHSF